MGEKYEISLNIHWIFHNKILFYFCRASNKIMLQLLIDVPLLYKQIMVKGGRLLAIT